MSESTDVQEQDESIFLKPEDYDYSKVPTVRRPMPETSFGSLEDAFTVPENTKFWNLETIVWGILFTIVGIVVAVAIISKSDLVDSKTVYVFPETVDEFKQTTQSGIWLCHDKDTPSNIWYECEPKTN